MSLMYPQKNQAMAELKLFIMELNFTESHQFREPPHITVIMVKIIGLINMVKICPLKLVAYFFSFSFCVHLWITSTN